MSCCGGKCGCGSSCSCGSGCNGCGRNADFGYLETSGASAMSLVAGVAPQKSYMERAEMGEAGESGGCKCGSDCKCDPCTCK